MAINESFLIAYLLIYLQLNLIIDLLGTPSLDDLYRAGASEGATKYILQKGHKAVSLLNPNVSDFVFHFFFFSTKSCGTLEHRLFSNQRRMVLAMSYMHVH